MEENLRKHILSEYTNTVGMEMVSNPTLNTATMEISDPDEFRLSEELSNNSNILMAQIRHTYTVETSDEDEFLFMYDAKRGK